MHASVMKRKLMMMMIPRRLRRVSRTRRRRHSVSGGRGGRMLSTLLPRLRPCRCRANMAHTRHSRPDFGLDFQIKVLKPLSAVPSWLDSGCKHARCPPPVEHPCAERRQAGSGTHACEPQQDAAGCIRVALGGLDAIASLLLLLHYSRA